MRWFYVGLAGKVLLDRPDVVMESPKKTTRRSPVTGGFNEVWRRDNARALPKSSRRMEAFESPVLLPDSSPLENRAVPD